MADRYIEEIQKIETQLNVSINYMQSLEKQMNELTAFITDSMSLITSHQFLENDYRIFASKHEGAPKIPETGPEEKIQKAENIAGEAEINEISPEYVTALYISEDKEEPALIELSVDQLLNDSRDYGMIRNHNDNTAILYRQNDQGDIGEISTISSILRADIRSIYTRLNGDVYIIGLGNSLDKYVSLTTEQITYYETALKKNDAIENIEPDESETEQENINKEQTPGKISCLLVKPGQYPEKIVIAHTLENLQHAVGGMIQEFYFDGINGNDAVIICNEEGKINGSDLNRAIRDDYGNISEIIAGNFLVVGNGYGDFISLSDKQLDKYEKMFHQPETFHEFYGNIYADPIPDEDVKIRNGNKENENNKIQVEYGLREHEEGKPYEVYMNAVVKYDDGSETPLYASCELDVEHQEKSFEFLENEIERQAKASTDLDDINRLDFNCFQTFGLPQKRKTNDTPEQLANDLEQFAKENDTYNYMDAYGSENSLDNTVDLLESGDVEPIKDWLKEIIEDDPNLYDAQDLLERVDAMTSALARETETETVKAHAEAKADDNAEEKSKQTQGQETSRLTILDKENFEYNGYHFKPVGIADDPTNVADLEYVERSEGDHIDYNQFEFYEKSNVPTILNADVFYCFEYNNYYYADNDCLVEYYGGVNPIINEEEKKKAEIPEEEVKAETLPEAPKAEPEASTDVPENNSEEVKTEEPDEGKTQEEPQKAERAEAPKETAQDEEQAPMAQQEEQNREAPKEASVETSAEMRPNEPAQETYHVDYSLLNNQIFGKDVAYMSTTVKDEQGEEKAIRLQIAFDHDDPQKSYNYLKDNIIQLAQENAYITPDQLEFDDFKDFDALKHDAAPNEHEAGYTEQHNGYTEKTEKVYKPGETNLPYGVETHTLKFDDDNNKDETQPDMDGPSLQKSI